MVFLFTACDKEQVPIRPGLEISPVTITLSADETERMVLLETDYRVPEKEIIQRAGNLIRALKTRQTGKSSTHYDKIVLIDSLESPDDTPSTKYPEIENPELKIYVVSLGETGGYALYGGDKRARNLLAYSETGSFDPDNKLLNEALLNYMAAEIKRKEAMRGDTVYNRLLARYGTIGTRPATKTKVSVWNGYEYIIIEVDNVTSQYIGTETESVYAKWALLKSQWGGDRPYCNQIMGTKGYMVPGATIAVAQIMNYHKHGSFAGHTYMWDQYVNSDWTNTSQEVQNDIAKLYYDLGKPENLNAQYKNTGNSWVRIETIPQAMPGFGYQTCNIQTYNIQTISEALYNNTPVYIQGHSAGTSRESGWAWVIDGENNIAEWMVYSKTYYNQ